MKKLFFASAFAVFTLTAMAQHPPEHKPVTPEQVAQRQANALSERLTLTEAQRSKAYSIFLDNAKKRQEQLVERQKEMEKRRKQDEAASKQEDSKIEQLLNADQKKDFQKFTERRERRFDEPGFGMSGRGFERDPRTASGFRRFGMPNEEGRPGDFNRMPERGPIDNQQDMNRPDNQPGRNPNDNGKPFLRRRQQPNSNMPDSSNVTPTAPISETTAPVKA